MEEWMIWWEGKMDRWKVVRIGRLDELLDGCRWNRLTETVAGEQTKDGLIYWHTWRAGRRWRQKDARVDYTEGKDNLIKDDRFKNEAQKDERQKRLKNWNLLVVLEEKSPSFIFLGPWKGSWRVNLCSYWLFYVPTLTSSCEQWGLSSPCELGWGAWWFGPSCLLGASLWRFFHACPTKRGPRIPCRDYISHLARACLGIPQEEPENTAGEKDVWNILFSPLTRTRLSRWKRMNGTMKVCPVFQINPSNSH